MVLFIYCALLELISDWKNFNQLYRITKTKKIEFSVYADFLLLNSI